MLFLIFWATLCAGQTPRPICLPALIPTTDRERHDIKGRVKVMRRFAVWFRKDEQTGRIIQGKPQLEEEVKFDAEGNLTDWQNRNVVPYDPNNTTVVEYECDGPTRIKEIRFRQSKEPAFKKTVYGYDDNGLKTDEAKYFADGTLETLVKYKYDQEGNLIEEILKQHVHPEHFIPKRYDVYVTTRRTFGYDSLRNKISETHYRPNGSFYARWVFEYDHRKNLIKETRIDNLGRLEHQYFYKFDDHNRLVEEKKYDNSCYKRNNEFCDGVVNSGEGIFHYLTKTIYEYDRNGNLVRERQLSMGGDSGSRRYTPDHTIIRKIVYYQDDK